jgi:hypothetical protein
VPAIFWANEAWRTTHATQWKRLAAQVREPLMHADLVPTFLDAAGVRYDEPRPGVVDLLAQQVPQRPRPVQQTSGVVLDARTLAEEAADAGLGPPLVPSPAAVADAGRPAGSLSPRAAGWPAPAR